MATSTGALFSVSDTPGTGHIQPKGIQAANTRKADLSGGYKPRRGTWKIKQGKLPKPTIKSFKP